MSYLDTSPSRNSLLRQLQKDNLMVGQTRAGRVVHIAIHGYDVSTYPHPGPTPPYALCSPRFDLTTNLMKYETLVSDMPINRIELCTVCFGQRANETLRLL